MIIIFYSHANKSHFPKWEFLELGNGLLNILGIYFEIVGQEFMDGMDVFDAPLQPDPQVSVPVEADFIFAYSTVPGYYSWRNSTEGSWFIQSVVEVFNKYCYHMDILQMLTKVSALVSNYKSRNNFAPNKRQVSSTVSMLRKDLYFFPEKVSESSNNVDDTSECRVA